MLLAPKGAEEVNMLSVHVGLSVCPSDYALKIKLIYRVPKGSQSVPDS